MSVEDRKLKNINVRVKDSLGIYRTINLIEHDIVNLFFKDPDTKKTIQIETGEIIKIGLDKDEKPYLVVFSYNYYLDNNLFHVPCSSLTQIITVNHSSDAYTITPVYSADESVAVLRSNDSHLEYTLNGKDWIVCGGGDPGITIDDVDREIESYLSNYSTSNQVDEKINTAIADFVTGDQVDAKIEESLATYAKSDSPTFTGDVNIPTYLQSENNDLAASTSFVHTAIDNLKEQIGSPLHFRGVVETEEDLNNIEDKKLGDVYQVLHAHSGSSAEFAYTENGWIELGTIIDLSNYATLDNVSTAVLNAINTVNSYTDEKASSTLAESKSYTDTKITEATADFVTGAQVDEKISIATADFVTGTQVDEKISTATADFVTGAQVDEKISTATANFVTGEQVDAKISRATEDFITADETSTMIEEATADFVTGAQVDEKISTATVDFITDAEADNKISEALVPYATLNDPTFTGNVNVPTYLQADNSNLVASTAYVHTAIEDLKEQIGSPLHFRGVVETEEDLHNIENPQIGDVYQVTHAQSGNNAEFAYTETGWIELGTIIDLTGYATIEDVTTAVDTGVENARVYTDTAVGSALSEAKTYANGVGTSALNSAKSYTDEKVSTEATRADGYADSVAASTLNNAKSYTDTAIEGSIDSAKAYTDEKVSAEAIRADGYADGVGSSTLQTANEYTDSAIASVEDVYEICKARGYLGTKDEFYDALTEILNNISNIVINEQFRY